MRVIKFAVAIALVSSTSAFGAFFETESNNTAATANPIPGLTSCLSSNVGLASLAVGGADVDFYSVVVPSGCILTAITTPLDAFGQDPDTTLAVFAPDGLTQIISNDDAGTDGVGGGSTPNADWGSAVRYLNNAATAIYYLRVGVSPFSVGFPEESGPYALTVSLVPEPSTLVLLGLGAVALIRRRK